VHIDPGALAASIDALAGGDGGGEPASLEEGVGRVIDAARRLFTVTGVGLMLADAEGALRYTGATDPAARALETAQEDLGAGPCVDCFVLGAVVQTDDLAADRRWPELSARVVPDGVDAVLGVPVRVGGLVMGSLNVYRGEPHAWDGSDIGAVGAYAGVLEGLLGAAVAAHQRGVLAEQLQTALDRRVVIERAIGMLMERDGVGPVEAFGRLRSTARRERRPVAELAALTLGGEGLPAR
jgi:GAF domain-containing protein